MAQYLLPNGHLEIEDQKQINEIRNKITNITANYSSNGMLAFVSSLLN